MPQLVFIPQSIHGTSLSDGFIEVIFDADTERTVRQEVTLAKHAQSARSDFTDNRIVRPQTGTISGIKTDTPNAEVDADPEPGRSREIVADIRELVQSSERLTMLSPDYSLDEIVITSWAWRRDPQTGFAVALDIEWEQVEIIEATTIDLPPLSRLGSSKANRARPKVDRGRRTTVRVSGENGTQTYKGDTADALIATHLNNLGID